MSNRLRTISESITSVYESHVDTDMMMYADGIAKALQRQKTKLGNVWGAEILNAGSDGVNGNGGGRIKFTVPAVPSEVQYQVEVENHRTPGPKLDDQGVPIPGEEISEDLGDVRISVSIDDGPVIEGIYKDHQMAGLDTLVKGFVVNAINTHLQSTKI